MSPWPEARPARGQLLCPPASQLIEPPSRKRARQNLQGEECLAWPGVARGTGASLPAGCTQPRSRPYLLSPAVPVGQAAALIWGA